MKNKCAIITITTGGVMEMLPPSVRNDTATLKY